jgi:TniQ
MIESKVVMAHPVYECYSQWNINSPPGPARSRLFRLEPIGIGTVHVESLTSYIARLAAEHCVSSRKLLCVEALNPIGKATEYYRASPHFSAYQINGMGSFVELIVTAFEQLTLREDLHHMTLQTWGNSLSYQQLLRKKRAWCIYCYEERSRAEQSPYELLIWSLAAVTICIKHHTRLCDKCYYCKYQLPFLATDYHPGYCSRCSKWLGASDTAKSERSEEPVTEADVSRQFQIQHTVGELLSSTTGLKYPPSQQSFIANLIKLIEKNADGSINVFSNIVGIWSGTIRRLLASETKLSLTNLCQICSRLNVTALDLLAEQGNMKDLKRRHIVLEDVSALRVIRSWSEVEDNLKAVLKEHPPPSMEATARKLAYYPPKIKRHFPELCEQIIFRYREYQRDTRPSPETILKAFQAALKESPPPSLQMVFRRMGCVNTGCYYYRHYKDLCLKVSRRFKEYRNIPFNKNKDRRRLEAVLAEEPPPSFSEVARRFRHNREFIRRNFPELSKAITSRYAHYQSAIRKESADRLRNVVREAIGQITTSGLYVSEARVKVYAKQQIAKIGRDSLFKQALREVESEMGLIK